MYTFTILSVVTFLCRYCRWLWRNGEPQLIQTVKKNILLSLFQDASKHIPVDQHYKGINDCFKRVYHEQVPISILPLLDQFFSASDKLWLASYLVNFLCYTEKCNVFQRMLIFYFEKSYKNQLNHPILCEEEIKNVLNFVWWESKNFLI